jgi:hypothetical protein
MPIAVAASPSIAHAPLHPSPLSASTSSLSSSNTISQAKTFYNQAARNFLHRRHVEAILNAEKAFIAFRAEGVQDHSLAERLVILRLTLLATIYQPKKVEQKVDMFSQLKATGKATSQDLAAITSLEALLSLPTLLFLTRLWVDVLRFYVEALPRLPTVQSRIPPTLTSSLSAQPDTLLSALQPPAGVVAAAIMGALRINDEGKESLSSLKGKKEAKTSRPKTEADMGEGLQAAKAMCEWVMSAHSKMAGTYASFNASELDHLYQQHTRVLQLYTLHILGTRLEQWELAHQVARCAVEIREDEQELQDRQSLLDQLSAAQAHISTRGERRRIASEKARQRYEEEKAKRAASAQQQANTAPSAEDPSLLAPAPVAAALERAPRLRRSDSGVSNASSSTSASEMESEGGIPSKRSSSSSRKRSVGEASKSGADYAEKRDLISHHLDRQHKRASGSPSDEKSMEWRSRNGRNSAGHLMQDRLLAWARLLGGNPSLLMRWLTAIIATLFILKRAFSPVRVQAPPSAAPLHNRRIAESTRSRLELSKRQNESIITTAARKVWDTLRM